MSCALDPRSGLPTAGPGPQGCSFPSHSSDARVAQRSCISGNKYSLDQDQANNCRSSQATCASPQLQKLTTGMPAGEPDRGSSGSYLAHKDQRFPEFCLANGTDVTCLTALLAGGTNSVGLSGRGAKKPQCQRV